jgi:hypothetical protein
MTMLLYVAQSRLRLTILGRVGDDSNPSKYVANHIEFHFCNFRNDQSANNCMQIMFSLFIA